MSGHPHADLPGDAGVAGPHRGRTLQLLRYEINLRVSRLLSRLDRWRSAAESHAMQAAGRRRAQTRASNVLEDASEMCRPFVHETLHYKTLHFSLMEAQSRMLKREPCTLVVDYTRTMMGFLLFVSQPQRIAMIGLGGGSLAKFCYRELPRTCIDVVEVNPHVVALRDEFHVPPDDERFCVHLDDGARFIRHARRQFDVILVDGYTRAGIPAKLASQAFYDQCRHALCDNGIMVLNLYCDDADVHIQRIRRSFGRTVFTVCETDGTNQVVFAHGGHAPLAGRSSTIHEPRHLRRAARSLLKPAFSRVMAAMLAQCEQVPGPSRAAS